MIIPMLIIYTFLYSRQTGVERLFSGCAVVLVFWLWWEMVFIFASIPRVQYMMACRNNYFEEMDDGQMTSGVS
jgi:hypothetical protein